MEKLWIVIIVAIFCNLVAYSGYKNEEKIKAYIYSTYTLIVIAIYIIASLVL